MSTTNDIQLKAILYETHSMHRPTDLCWGTSSQLNTVVCDHCSIIQGSGLVPVAYIHNSSDLHLIHSSNILLKYIDDTYLIVPAANSIPWELQNISQWASNNNLKLNSSK